MPFNQTKEKVIGRNLTLDKLQSISRTFELSETHSKKMESHETTQNNGAMSQTDEVNRVRSNHHGRGRSSRGARPKQPARQPRAHPPTVRRSQLGRRHDTETALCYRCGETGHYGRNCEKTKGVTCFACHGKNHFSHMCKSKVKNVNSLLDNSSSNEEEREEIFTLNGKNDATISLNVEGKTLNFLIDSGASVNAIDKSLYDQIKTTENVLQHSDAKIYPMAVTHLSNYLAKQN